MSFGSSPSTFAVTGCPTRRPSHEHYTQAGLWAYDLAAIIEELELERAVLVGWSYGAFVICDYIRAYGQDWLGALDFVGGAVKLGEAAFGTLIGPGFLDHFADATSDDCRPAPPALAPAPR